MTFCNTLVVVRITALSSWSKKLIRIVVREDAVPCAGVFISWRTKSKHICFIWLLICISSTNLCLYGHLVMYLLIMGWFQGCFDGVTVENYSLYCTKKRSFPLAILLVNMNKFTETCALHSQSFLSKTGPLLLACRRRTIPRSSGLFLSKRRWEKSKTIMKKKGRPINRFHVMPCQFYFAQLLSNR